MFSNLLKYSINDIINGYSYDENTKGYICHICNKNYIEGEIFKYKGRYFEAYKMIEFHMKEEHFNMLHLLMENPKKYTGVTDNQKNILSMIAKGMPVNEIAKNLGVASSTIRHQKFVFREKAKQAKLFLAIYELANRQKNSNDDDIIEIHEGATMLDDRYSTTKKEEKQIIDNLFSSVDPLILKTFPVKEKRKIVVLRKITEIFEKDRKYSEKDINKKIQAIYHDFATIRRYLIEYGFMQRTQDCKEYWIR